jgi:uncharacterized protein YqjF (DUF2071 family)
MGLRQPVAGLKPFLTATWRHLVMINWEIDPGVLAPYLPAGVELDAWNGRTYASLVGFLFLDTRVLGLRFPYHRDFEEVNLRFYVRRETDQGLLRGVVFVKEIVPRWAIAAIARGAYGEKYMALPMQHRIELTAAELQPGSSVEYSWRLGRRWQRMCVRLEAGPALPPPGSEAEFITEHYWGYARRRDGSTVEYQVEHPQWRVWTADQVEVECDFARLYGTELEAVLSQSPASAFVADGSAVTVYRGRQLTP